MNAWKFFSLVICTSILSGCAINYSDFEPIDSASNASDLLAPPYEDHPNLKAADIARSRGDIPQAIHDYRQVIKDNDGYCEKAYLGLGISLLDANATEESKKTFEKAITLYPNSAGAYAGLGAVYLVVDQPENAMKAFETALKLNPCFAKALNGYGIALDMIGDHQGAQANYRAAMELDPGNISYESNLGLSLALSGNTSEAIRILERLSRSPLVTARVRQNLSLAYGLAGDLERARSIGRVDLSGDWVQNNISYIESIRDTEEYAGLIPKNHMTGPLNDTRKWQDR